MKIFTNKAGVPTIVISVIVLLFGLISLPRGYNFYRTVGTGHSYRELRASGAAHDQSRVRSGQDGIHCGILMVFGQNIPITMLIIIAVGLISKTTTIQFKRMLRIFYLVVAGFGVIFFSFGSSYWGQALPFPSSLGPALVIYVAISAVLWAIIGIGVLIRGKQTPKDDDAEKGGAAKISDNEKLKIPQPVSFAGFQDIPNPKQATSRNVKLLSEEKGRNHG